MRVEKEDGKPQVWAGGLGRPLGEVLSLLLGRGGESPLESGRKINLTVAPELPERCLGDRDLGFLLESLLACSAEGPLGLRVSERTRLGGLEGLLRPRLSWVQIQLSGEGAAISEPALEECLASHGYRKIERVTRLRPSAALSLFWRSEERSLPLVVENRSKAGQAKLCLLIPEVSF
jgi:hypothetical protein